MPEQEYYGEAHSPRGLRRMRQDTTMLDSVCSPNSSENQNKRQRIEGGNYGTASAPMLPFREPHSLEETTTGDLNPRHEEGENAVTTLLEVLPCVDKQALQELRAKYERAIESHQHDTNKHERLIELQQNMINILKRDVEKQPLAWLGDLSYPRSRQHQLSDDEIEPWMIQLEENATEISDLILEDWQKPSNPVQNPKMEQDGDLLSLISIVSGTANGFEIGDLRTDYVLRSFIAASISEWIFQDDKFLKTTHGSYWNEFKILLIERAIQHSSEDADKVSHQVATAVEGFEQDTIDRQSNHPELINRVLPARASTLAKRLASLLVGFLRKLKYKTRRGIQQNVHQDQSEGSWLRRLEDLFLDALKFFIRLRQRKTNTSLEWPEKDAVFNRRTMRALDCGSTRLLNSQGIALTIMPAAVIEAKGGSGKRMKREAVVYLNLPQEQSVSSNGPEPATKTPEIIDKSSATVAPEKQGPKVCSRCGEIINKKRFRKTDLTCQTCVSKEYRQEVARAKQLKAQSSGMENPSTDQVGQEVENIPDVRERQSKLASASNVPSYQKYVEYTDLVRDRPDEYIPAPILDDPEKPWSCPCGKCFGRLKYMLAHQARGAKACQRATSNGEATSIEPKIFDITGSNKIVREEDVATLSRKQEEGKGKEDTDSNKMQTEGEVNMVCDET